VDLVDMETVDADAYAHARRSRLHITGVTRDVAASLRSAGMSRPVDTGQPPT
jgi:hypothetical protein